MVDSTFLCFVVSEIIQDLMSEGRDIERALHQIGRKTGMKLLEMFRFDRDVDLPSLVYKITYSLLPQIYESGRKAESLKDKENVFVITENEPLFGMYMQPSESNSRFCADTVVAGIIEMAICATGYRCSVNAYISPTESPFQNTVYIVEVINSVRVFESY